MEEQALSIEQMKELEGLGIDTSNASMCWYHYHIGMLTIGWECFPKDIEDYVMIPKIDSEDILEKVPTFTLQDILEILPHTLEFQDVYGNTHFEYIEFWGDGWNQMAVVNPLHPSSPRITTSNINPLRSAFEMLKYVKQNGYI